MSSKMTTGPDETAAQTAPIFNKRGQRMGKKGGQAREALLDALADLLGERHPWEIGVSDICARCGVAQYNYYTYFGGVEEALLSLAHTVAAEQPELVSLIDGDWSGSAGLARSMSVIERSFAFWSRHANVLLIADLLADRGTPEFLEVRRLRRRPLIDAFDERIREAQVAGALDPLAVSFIAAVDVVTSLDSMCARYPALLAMGLGAPEIVDSSARILQMRVAGRSAMA